jgi:hypothetical protein
LEAAVLIYFEEIVFRNDNCQGELMQMKSMNREDATDTHDDLFMPSRDFKQMFGRIGKQIVGTEFL